MSPTTGLTQYREPGRVQYPKRCCRPENKWINENGTKISHKLIHFSEFLYSQSCRIFVKLAVANDYIKKAPKRGFYDKKMFQII